MIRHIIFDCFGTLIDTGNNSIKAVEQIFYNVGVNLDAQKFYKDWKAKKRQKMNASVCELFPRPDFVIHSLLELVNILK